MRERGEEERGEREGRVKDKERGIRREKGGKRRIRREEEKSERGSGEGER